MSEKKTTKSKKGVPLKCGRCNKFKGKSKNVADEDKCNCGRPEKKNENIIGKLEEAFKNDFTIRQACTYAGIDPTTLYDWCKKDEELSKRIDRARQWVSIMAKKNLAKSITEEKSVDSSKWLLERRESSIYNTKQVNENVETNNNEIDDKRKDELDKLLDANL